MKKSSLSNSVKLSLVQLREQCARLEHERMQLENDYIILRDRVATAKTKLKMQPAITQLLDNIDNVNENIVRNLYDMKKAKIRSRYLNKNIKQTQTALNTPLDIDFVDPKDVENAEKLASDYQILFKEMIKPQEFPVDVGRSNANWGIVYKDYIVGPDDIENTLDKLHNYDINFNALDLEQKVSLYKTIMEAKIEMKKLIKYYYTLRQQESMGFGKHQIQYEIKKCVNHFNALKLSIERIRIVPD